MLEKKAEKEILSHYEHALRYGIFICAEKLTGGPA